MDINERFMYACENGDFLTVRGILEAIPDFDINVQDSLGRTPLRLAVEFEHLEVSKDSLMNFQNHFSLQRKLF
jgi:ankyrin repeat protein